MANDIVSSDACGNFKDTLKKPSCWFVSIAVMLKPAKPGRSTSKISNVQPSILRGTADVGAATKSPSCRPMQNSACPECLGVGRRRVYPAKGPRTGELKTCTLCEGKGEISTQHKRWLEQGKAARDRRIAAGLSQKDVAARIGVTARRVNDMEHARDNPAPLLNLEIFQPKDAS
jgi:DNA-binding XRE family transcriptional regulator